MRIARFIAGNQQQPRYAFVQQDKNDGKDYLIALDGYPLSGAQVKPTGERFAVDSDGVRLLAPIIPSKVFGLAKNYEAHAKFMAGDIWKTVAPPDEMMIFSKPSTAVVGPDDPIVYPSWSHELNYEPEVAVVMGKVTRDVSPEDAMKHVLGFTCVNDVTARDAQRNDPMWTRAKGFDSACPLGPWIQTELDYAHADISFSLNGEPVKDAAGNTENLIHSIPDQIAFISTFSTLLPGDVIMTGTPYATGALHPGDETVVTVAGIGSLRNIVVAR
ncbi:MAG: fumarylacetoacetate hydrolase family protein [Bifidobacteriaceae bacterium]|jgi:2-keto-4-pentenoate hydratase/2-oxohepta-3-ene-1,7-dioic acid hydratase in catechol pathway|nr:fumarylacetoacetate hydrolase family protein [Bifidobacteriaceae bacterium]MCI1979212.1 fumarylacetoacetate hydrolase family protein [Bifidobacteriaceae bacterium]